MKRLTTTGSSSSTETVAATVGQSPGMRIFVVLVTVVAGLILLILLIIYIHRKHKAAAVTLKSPKKIEYAEPCDQEEEIVPMLYVSLKYDYGSNKLELWVNNAQNLQAPFETVDSFVRITAEPKSLRLRVHKTKISPETVNPTFEKVIKYRVFPTDLKEVQFIFDVFDRDISGARNTLLGTARFALGNVDINDFTNVQVEFPLRITDSKEDDGGHGELCLVLNFSPQNSELKVTVLEAKGLNFGSKSNINRTGPVYVELEMRAKRKIIAKYKTRVVKGTRDPYFMDTFVFHVKTSQVNLAQLRVRLMTHNSIRFQRCIGAVTIGNDSTTNTGQMHWADMLDNQKRAVSAWHAAFDPNTFVD